MERCDEQECHAPMPENDSFKEKQSIENFQNFMYDLFEKNGILNDLRAYLRGHIIDVLKSAKAGAPPTCQKRFTQRLELSYQAMNMLIAEYLLRLDFNYSLSVFVSEIPLANMVFEFAKDLMKNYNGDVETLKFSVGDVWSILNYLGIKCDSEYATNIVDTYKKESLPLVMCLLRCVPYYDWKSSPFQGTLSESSSSSVKSLDSLRMDNITKSAFKVSSALEKCRHCSVCKVCQSKIDKLREKYRIKKEHIYENIRTIDFYEINIKNLMGHMGEMEQNLIDEMFEQLQSVYEAEVDMLRRNEEKKIKRSLASHALQLQRQKEEMEDSFKKREAELEKNIRDKKKFLWELARSLREQHAQMSRAMLAVREETDKLTTKERTLETQLSEAEKVLKQRGDEMRTQISDELKILEGHLDSMKKERETINKERAELEQIKNSFNNNDVIKAHDNFNDDLRSHNDLLKDELSILKKYLETSKLEPKCVIERSTLTELSDVTSRLNIVLNNEQDAVKNLLKCENEDRIKTSNQVVNDLKKQKNVNFRKPDISELYHENSRERTRERSCNRSSASSEVCDGILKESERDRDLVERLRDENERLREFATQQREHIDELSSHQARLQAELTAARFREIPMSSPSRPRTAPYMTDQGPTQYRLTASPSARSVGWRKGAGEEISMFANAQPRILLPGDSIPFIGVLKDRHNGNRRHLINQWRTMRRRVSPISPSRLPTATSTDRDRSPIEKPASPTRQRRLSPLHMCSLDDTYPQVETEGLTFPDTSTRERPKNTAIEAHQPREKSPKSVLKEAKEKLKNYVRDHPAHASTTRDKSPKSVLREAKMRLRKLEIEAEAVEKSYLDFRRRQQLKDREDVNEVTDLGSNNIQNKQEIQRNEDPRLKLIDLSSPTKRRNYENEYIKLNTMSYFRNRISALNKAQPIPSTLKNIEVEIKQSEQRRDYYLETPLTEFRKLYHSQRPVIIEKSETKANIRTAEKNEELIAVDEDSIKDFTENKSEYNSPESNDKIELPKANMTEIDDHNKEDINKKLLLIGDVDKINILKDNDPKFPEPQDISREISLDDIVHLSNDEVKTTVKLDTSIEIPPIVEFGNLNNDEAKTNEKPDTLIEIPTTDDKPELLVVIESSIDTKEIDISQTDMHEPIPTQMTIIVSNKRTETVSNPESKSPEQAARVTNNDALNAIFNSEAKADSSVEIELNISNGIIDKSSEIEKAAEDYADDFSADVENNSRSEYETHSPISLPKHSEDENF